MLNELIFIIIIIIIILHVYNADSLTATCTTKTRLDSVDDIVSLASNINYRSVVLRSSLRLTCGTTHTVSHTRKAREKPTSIDRFTLHRHSDSQIRRHSMFDRRFIVLLTHYSRWRL